MIKPLGSPQKRRTVGSYGDRSGVFHKSNRIEMLVRHSDREVAELAMRWDQIVPANGEDLLLSA